MKAKRSGGLGVALPRGRPALSASPWMVLALGLAAVAASPILAVLGVAAGSSRDLLQHLAATVLPGYVGNTLVLSALVAVGVLVTGGGTAWLVTLCRFPGRRAFSVLLLLPMAMPTYLAAFAYTELLEYSGPIQGALRAVFDWRSKQDYWFPEVRSVGGAALFMTLVLYPYVYLLARAAFLQQSAALLEAGRSLGRDPWRCFLTVALPLARPALAVGTALALMETLNDFGTVDYFAVPTLTVGIFRVWFSMGQAAGAAQLAVMLLALVLGLQALERLARRRQRFHEAIQRAQPAAGLEPQGVWRAAAVLACALPVILGFVVPAGVMLWHSLEQWRRMLEPAFARALANSLSVAALTAVICVAAGTLLAYAYRLSGSRWVGAVNRIAASGYAVPGTVLAVGVLIPAAALDGLLRQWLGGAGGLLLGSSVAALVFACVVRFLALGYGSMEAGLARITPSMDDAARSLGQTAAGAMRRVHLPLLRGSLLTATLLVFVDAMKELPMTLVLRPFNFSTLAVHVYEYASAERFQAAAPAALTIVAAGIGPVLLLSRAIARHGMGVPLPGEEGTSPPAPEAA